MAVKLVSPVRVGEHKKEQSFSELLSMCLELKITTITIKAKPCISSIPQGIAYHQRGTALYIIIAKVKYSLRLMIYSLWRDMLVKADEIHADA